MDSPRGQRREVHVPCFDLPAGRGKGGVLPKPHAVGAGTVFDGTISTYLGGLPLRVLSPATRCPPLGRRDDASPHQTITGAAHF